MEEREEMRRLIALFFSRYRLRWDCSQVYENGDFRATIRGLGKTRSEAYQAMAEQPMLMGDWRAVGGPVYSRVKI